ncbi:hypothetical protein NXC12_CH01404 [Rhizobium etli]|uniref:Uncharacterized protein n=1 Tax=Rhizobium etli TaxID=29449 RepID=A0AAN1BEG6_RHIET|nr:hypothetical protein NXC12_CH01404 [Rhizobium etli]
MPFAQAPTFGGGVDRELNRSNALGGWVRALGLALPSFALVDWGDGGMFVDKQQL